MKKKVLVVYSVLYCKEVELEVRKEIKSSQDLVYDHLIEDNEDIIDKLIVPDHQEGSDEYVQYVEDSFEIEYFQL